MAKIMMQILIKGAKPFKKGREGDAAYDIWSLYDHIILPLTSVEIQTGIATAFPADWVALIVDRSGLGFKGAIHRGGLIDSNWRGEWKICLFNSSAEPLQIEGCLVNPKAKACAQVIFIPCMDVGVELVDCLPSSERGNQWKGSSDACVST